MYREIQIRLLPQEAHESSVINAAVGKYLGIARERIKHTDIIKRSVDARHIPVMLVLYIGVHIDNVEERPAVFIPEYRDVSGEKQVIIVGAGPAGLFAALRLIEKGFCPLILERGKCVAERKKDLKQLYATGVVDGDSNFGFGEGGAGTFSDGKLYTRSKKRGNIQRILEILVFHGADPGILIDSHPHIGTDKLPAVIQRIRETIEKYGGRVLFNTRVDDILVHADKVRGVVASGREYICDRVILATGHSARDVYRFLHNRKIYLEPKDFAVGLRLEHLQSDIDSMQYHTPDGRGAFLHPAEYSFVTNVEGRGVYSFCMCPGGVVVPAATASGQQVVNGMSSSNRNTAWANSAIVTAVGEKELVQMNFGGLFAGIEFQEYLEKVAWQQGGGELKAPAQTLTDFLRGRYAGNLPATSYKPGVIASDIHEWFPEILYLRLKEGMAYFGKRTKGFLTDKALLLGVESRTSSPIRIVRNQDTNRHIHTEGLYPCGEGAGYAGGIVSAAMDGEKCAESLAGTKK